LIRILVIDDEKSIRFSLKVSLLKQGYEVYEAETGEEGLEIFKMQRPEVAIVDIKLPGIDGIEVLSNIKKMDPDCLVIMITHLGDVRLAVKAMKLGAYDYFTKPFSLKDIDESIREVHKYLDTKKKLDKMSYKPKLIGNSLAISRIKEIVKKISSINMETCILIQGESGTGKDIIAQLIHEGKGHDKPFVALNCASVPSNLQESELFGHKKGAFTGAVSDKVGLIEKANGGVLFLDEIGDMDLELQAKMLRVLQEKKYRPIGSTQEFVFNATIVAATNRNLKQEIEKGNFRDDLYYRLNVIPIYVPPLRERKEDIPLLIQNFLEEYNLKLGKNIKGFSQEAMDVMMSYDWPGNVRELRNTLERICIFQEKDIVEIKDLPKDLVAEFPTTDRNLNPLEASERKVILETLNKNNWNITKTADELGMSRSTLRRKMEMFNIKKQ